MSGTQRMINCCATAVLEERRLASHACNAMKKMSRASWNSPGMQAAVIAEVQAVTTVSRAKIVAFLDRLPRLWRSCQLRI